MTVLKNKLVSLLCANFYEFSAAEKTAHHPICTIARSWESPGVVFPAQPGRCRFVKGPFSKMECERSTAASFINRSRWLNALHFHGV